MRHTGYPRVTTGRHVRSGPGSCSRTAVVAVAALLTFWHAIALGQCLGVHPTGNVLRTYVDASRGNRAVPLRVDYPAVSSGENAEPVRSCAWPAFAFGHGFTIPGDAYAWLRDALVPSGLVLLRPSTESGLSPNHREFARDLNFVLREVRLDPFFANVFGPDSIVGGHSMGGGAAVLAASERPVGGPGSDLLLVFAPAETNPSAIAAAASVAMPTLMFTGSRDCVTPASQHAQPILMALLSTDKTRHDIAGGSHCQFSDGSVTCSLGESSCGGSATIASSAQQAAVRSLMLPWLQQRRLARVFGNGFEALP